jgi:hypothetical protein
MPQRISSYGLAFAKDHTAIIYNGVPGVEGEGREPVSHLQEGVLQEVQVWRNVCHGGCDAVGRNVAA